MPVPGLSLLGLERIRGFLSILRYINPTIIIIIVSLAALMEDIHGHCGLYTNFPESISKMA